MIRRVPARRTPLLLGLVLVAVLVAVPLLLSATRGEQPNAPFKVSGDRVFMSSDPIERGCALDRKILVRIWRGVYKKRGGDLMLVPQAPNFSGGFVVPGHTGPWDYLQKVPLVLYGPPRIAARGEVKRPVNITDVYPTVGALTHSDLPPRDGKVLHEALGRDRTGAPRLIVTIVWDGAGDNVLARWPQSWPNLRRLMRQGTAYSDASIGSTPSITPATHANLGTGAYPRKHGITAINMRRDNGELITAIAGRDPRDLELTTFGDEVDRLLGNRPKVGMLAWKAWHIPMLGHGTQTPGGDADELALIGAREGDITGNPAWYSTPGFLHGFPGLSRYARQVDREDGRADGKWMGHDLAMHDNPSWVRYEGDILRAMLKRGGYGSDDVPDLFFTNFKISDIVGHQYTMASEEMGAVLKEQDAQLGRLVDFLDRRVKDYVVVVTADHGHTPPWRETGGWPIVIKEVGSDIDDHFDVPPGKTLITSTSPAGLFFDHDTMREMHVSPEAIAKVVNDYTIRDNWPRPELPKAFQKRADEQVFSAGFLRTQLPEIMRCAFGSARPPRGFHA